jgi:hypothetical protein
MTAPTAPAAWGAKRWDTTATRRPGIGLGDLIAATGYLDAGEAIMQQVAVLLGLVSLPPTPVSPPRTPGSPEQPPIGTGPILPITAAVAADEADVDVRPAGDDPRTARPARLRAVTSAAPAPPRPPRATVDTLFPAGSSPRLPLEPLFLPHHERAVLSALAAVSRPGREVDIAALVEELGTRRAVDRIPRLLEATTRLGVQLILDQGAGMRPFARDLGLLARSLRRIVGADAVDVLDASYRLDLVSRLDTDEDQIAGTENGADVERAYQPPARGRPVLLATDLGISATLGPAPARQPADVMRLAEAVRGAGCPFVVLVPYPPARWPAWAVGRLTLVHWDRPTVAGQALRAQRRAQAIAGVLR